MTLKRREKILASAAAALVAVVALQFVSSSLSGPSAASENRLATLATEVERSQNLCDKGAQATKKLELYRKASLPSDPEVAQSLYEIWLRQLATEAKLSDTKITYLSRQRVGEVYHALRFSVHAKATLAELTEFLYGFYRAGYLHQIVSLTMTPKDGGSSLDVQIVIQALSLAGAPATNKLAAVESDRALDRRDVYREKIAGRNLFATYQPPRPPDRRPPPVEPVDFVDPLDYTELNAIVSVGDRRQVWINAKMTGEHYELFEGEEVRIGAAKCKVLRIGDREAEIEIDGKPCLVAYGKSLRAGKPLSRDE